MINRLSNLINCNRSAAKISVQTHVRKSHYACFKIYTFISQRNPMTELLGRLLPRSPGMGLRRRGSNPPGAQETPIYLSNDDLSLPSHLAWLFSPSDLIRKPSTLLYYIYLLSDCGNLDNLGNNYKDPKDNNKDGSHHLT